MPKLRKEIIETQSRLLTETWGTREWDIGELEKELLRRELERDFLKFQRWVFEKIYRRPFHLNWHHEVIAKELEDVYNLKTKRLLITIPPRYHKSEGASIQYPAWCYAKNPQCNFIHTSYSAQLVNKNSAQIQSIIESEPFQELWPVQFSQKEKGKSLWTTDKGGSFFAVQSGGGITGFGCGVSGSTNFSGALLADDPLKAHGERHELSRKNVVENFEQVLSSRLNGPHVPIVVIMQRLHEEDLAGHLLSGESVTGSYRHINIPAIKEGPPNDIDPRNEGEALWPEKHSVETLMEMEKKNPTLFAGQYQQRPAPAEGAIVKRAYIRYYDSPPPTFNKGEYISVDMNFKEGGTSNACFSHYGIDGANVYLLNQVVGRWNFVEAEAQLKRFIPQNYRGVLVEAKANGEAMIAVLMKEGYRSVIPIQCDKSKEYRLSEVLMLYRAGNVWYPNEKIAPWIKEHVHEMLTFPNAKNDDRVDSESQMLKFVQDSLGQVDFYDY